MAKSQESKVESQKLKESKEARQVLVPGFQLLTFDF
jgi:hypothetical protein